MRIIKYLLLKIIKKLYWPDDNLPVGAAAEYLLDKLLPSAFKVFKDSEFRKIVNFDKISQVEQDRIFNELEVAAISIALFCLEERESVVQLKDFHFWKGVCEKMPAGFEDKLLKLGIDPKNARLFKDLIEIRHVEYVKISEGNRDWIDNDLRELKSEYAKEVMARVQAIAVGTADHIRRGKLKVGDALISHLRNWLFPLDMEITNFIKKL